MSQYTPLHFTDTPTVPHLRVICFKYRPQTFFCDLLFTTLVVIPKYLFSLTQNFLPFLSHFLSCLFSDNTVHLLYLFSCLRSSTSSFCVRNYFLTWLKFTSAWTILQTIESVNLYRETQSQKDKNNKKRIGNLQI